MKILVVEDDVMSARFLKVKLENLGHEVIAASDGQEGLNQFLKHRPPIVLSDWMMPRMDGLELCRKIRSHSTKDYTFFILQTARAQKSDYHISMNAGVDDFLAKPVNPDELAIRLRVTERIIQQRIDTDRKIQVLARFPSDNPNPVLQVDVNYRILYANVASLALLLQWRCGVGDLAPQKFRELAHLLFSTGQRQEIEVNCSDQVFSFSATSVSDDGVAYLYGHDITERKQAENDLVLLKDQAEDNALHDQLTGLPNRRLLTERLKLEIARATRQNGKLVMMVLDIDNFKQINDSYGHQLGDEVIVTVGECLRDTLRETDVVCRWGGDELVLLLPEFRDRKDIATICEKISRAVKERALAANISAPVSLSIGSAVFPDDADNSALLIQQADHALYNAKADGRDCWREFKGFPQGHDAKGKADLFMHLSAAVEEGKITAFFQPIIGSITQRVVGAEALARWHHEDHGWVSPDVFIPLAEEKGLILKLGRQVLVQALDQLAAWRKAGLEITVSVNLSKRQLLDSDFRQDLISLVEERKLKPEWIILEVTERQSVLGQALGRQRLEDLSAAGFHLSIDDFGSGYSSFDIVGDTSFSELKIHMGLVRNSHTSRGRRIVQAIVEMGRSLGLTMVGEGVEDHTINTMLTALGVQKLQGFLFSKPLQANAFLSFVEHHHARLREAA